MFTFTSSPCSDTSMDDEKSMFSYSSSPRSSFSSIETTKYMEKIFNTIEVTPSSLDLPPQPREGLRKRARHHFRSFCRHKSLKAKAVPAIPQETNFSYAVTPISNALQDLATGLSNSNQERAFETALIVDCNKSANRIQYTLECALETFPAENIFVVGNGKSQCPVNKTNSICNWLGVNHIWVPTSSKVVAQYVGIAAAHQFRYCLLIDDDFALPRNFPVLTDRIENNAYGGFPPIKCIGYAEDQEDDYQQEEILDYKLSALPKNFFGREGEVASTSFPHDGASLWERSFLERCFHQHPGYKSSPNWFLGVNLALLLEKKSNI